MKTAIIAISALLLTVGGCYAETAGEKKYRQLTKGMDESWLNHDLFSPKVMEERKKRAAARKAAEEAKKAAEAKKAEDAAAAKKPRGPKSEQAKASPVAKTPAK